LLFCHQKLFDISYAWVLCTYVLILNTVTRNSYDYKKVIKQKQMNINKCLKYKLHACDVLLQGTSFVIAGLCIGFESQILISLHKHIKSMCIG